MTGTENPTPVVMCWSGGKDSALALRTLLRDPGIEVRALLTTITEGYERISMHGVRTELLGAQAERLGLPVVEVRIPPTCSNELYEERMSEALSDAVVADVDVYAFGDLFLEDVREYREQRLGAVGKRCVFPIWGLETRSLAARFIDEGFRAVLSAVDPNQIDGGFAGREFDRSLLAALPPQADPCGENGEFHTFVHEAPIFRSPIAVGIGEVVTRDGFVFCDIVPA